MSPDHENDRLLVPESVVADLQDAGYIRTASDTLQKGGDAGLIVLTVYNTAASTITLLQTPGVIRALAQALIGWFRSDRPDPPKFELTARGPNGFVDLRMDTEPDTELLVAFLKQNIWGSEAPPEIEE